MDSSTSADPRPRFAQWIGDLIRRRGYDIDTPRGGGRTALATQVGMSASSVGRMLGGQAIPEVRALVALARALGVPVRTMLIRAGVVSEEDLPPFGADVVEPGRIDLYEAAAAAGVPPGKRDLFVGLVQDVIRRLSDDPPNGVNAPTIGDSKGRSAER